MEYQLVDGVRVAIPQLVINEGDPVAYAAADALGRSALLGPLQAAETERLASIDDGDIPLVIVEG